MFQSSGYRLSMIHALFLLATICHAGIALAEPRLLLLPNFFPWIPRLRASAWEQQRTAQPRSNPGRRTPSWRTAALREPSKERWTDPQHQGQDPALRVRYGRDQQKKVRHPPLRKRGSPSGAWSGLGCCGTRRDSNGDTKEIHTMAAPWPRACLGQQKQCLSSVSRGERRGLSW